VIFTLFAILAGFLEVVSVFLVSDFFSGFFTSLVLSAFDFSEDDLPVAGLAAGGFDLAGVPLVGADLLESNFVVSALPVSFDTLIGGFFSDSLTGVFSTDFSGDLPGAFDGFSGAASFGASLGFVGDFPSAGFFADAGDLASTTEAEESAFESFLLEAELDEDSFVAALGSLPPAFALSFNSGLVSFFESVALPLAEELEFAAG
jgi:hypothetical protein